ncbi:MAG TPA: bifunctional adenosylcobinamide kinase/adenosylcobinamide-phosphate guanylyltransferase [Stellaceae bacterium]|nr:bifunctional adenosylcobinamide kinase/adenosylcobinamide-phosphate guanylyltransferase [Stellaceae bacterium]
MLTLILGGARSGKSAHAEAMAREAESAGRSVVYIATGAAGDEEMAARIAHHRMRRPASWRTVEEPIRLADTLVREARPDRFLLVDCLTLWITNLLLAELSPQAAEQAALLQALPGLPGETVLVSNEVGMGLVAADPLSRRFVDETGRLHQAIAALADRVVLVAAGCVLPLKGR